MESRVYGASVSMCSMETIGNGTWSAPRADPSVANVARKPYGAVLVSHAEPDVVVIGAGVRPPNHIAPHERSPNTTESDIRDVQNVAHHRRIVGIRPTAR